MQTREITLKNNEEKVVPFVWINGEFFIGNLRENEVSVLANLAGEGAALLIVGIFLGRSHQSVSFQTSVIHQAKKTKSSTFIRGVFFDQSMFTNDGLVKIVKGAKGADGYFASKVLLFDDATGTSVPSLEIDENDLKAGHASTVGRPDKTQLLYLQSRGILQKDAERLLIEGYFEPAIVFLPIGVQDHVRKMIKKSLS